jgi:hypothetical protein
MIYTRCHIRENREHKKGTKLELVIPNNKMELLCSHAIT